MSTPLVGRGIVLALAAVLVWSLAGCGQNGLTAAPSASPANGESSASAGTAASGGPSDEPSSSGGSGTAPLACDIVTNDMIDEALGATVGGGTSQILDLGGSTCEFKDAGILVRVFPNRDASFLQAMKASFSGSVDLPGVGDGAFYSKQNATIMLLKGGTAVQVQAPNQNDQAKLAALAAAIASEL